MEPLILLDTSELVRPVTRKLHAAWAELGGGKAAVPPTVAVELAPQASAPDAVDGKSLAERMLREQEETAGPRVLERLEQQAWWARQWRNPKSPFEIVGLNEEQEERCVELAEQIDPRCFPHARVAYVPEHRDTRIICESIVLDAKMLLTSNMRSINHDLVNEWAVANGTRLGFTPEPVVFPADATLVRRAHQPDGLKRLVAAGLIACWPDKDDAPTEAVLQAAITGLGRMIEGTGGRLRTAGALVVQQLQEHPDPERLVEETRRQLPSPTITSDREHPNYPVRPRIRPPDPAGGNSRSRTRG